MATAAIPWEETDISSDELDKTPICQPCLEDNKQLPAVGYCVNCHEYLCQRCFDYHLVPSITKKHVLLDKEHLPSIEQNDNDPMCPEHRDEEIKYHCESHSFVGCHICSFKHQKTCKDVIYISEFFESITVSDELNTINQDIAGVTKKCTELMSNIKQKREQIGLHHDEAIAAMRQFKIEILDLIDKLEKDASDKANKSKEAEYLPLDTLSKQCQTMMMEIQKVKGRIGPLHNQEGEHQYKTYITIQQSKGAIIQLEDKIKGFVHDKPIKKIAFKANNKLFEMLKSPLGLGTLQSKGVLEKAEFVRNINIKTANDLSICNCRGSALLPGNKLIISDVSNYSIKLVDTKQNKLISGLKLTSAPWGVCAVSDCVVAVTLYTEKKVAIVGTDPELSLQREIGVNGTPYGIGYHDSKLIVTYCNPQKAEIMDTQGTVTNIFDKDNNGQALFNNPYGVTINPRNNLMYVSNNGSHSVVSMDIDGTVVASYNDNDMTHPIEATFDNSNNVYLCGRASNNVHVIMNDCRKVKVLLTSYDGLKYPNSIIYQENDDTIYIGLDGDNIKVFQLKYAKA